MQVNDLFDIVGAILLIALVAVVLTKKNTSKDVHSAGSAFTGAVRQAEAG
jgi:hypothetical protein